MDNARKDGEDDGRVVTHTHFAAQPRLVLQGETVGAPVHGTNVDAVTLIDCRDANQCRVGLRLCGRIPRVHSVISKFISGVLSPLSSTVTPLRVRLMISPVEGFYGQMPLTSCCC